MNLRSGLAIVGRRFLVVPVASEQSLIFVSMGTIKPCHPSL
jgi:hypothetical protein